MAAVQLLFAHGWGYDRHFWAPLAERLAERLPGQPPGEQRFIDLGFRGPAQTPQLDPTRPRVAIGHSLGFAWLLREGIACDALVAINGFTRFTADERGDWPGVAARPLARMRRQFARQPQAVWADFRDRCGAGDGNGDGDGDSNGQCDGDQPDFDLARMSEGLGWLADWDLRDARLPAPTPVPTLVPTPVPTLALAGDADRIVPPALSRASFAGPDCRLEWRSGGDHLLPRSAPDWCAERIARFIEGR